MEKIIIDQRILNAYNKCKGKIKDFPVVVKEKTVAIGDFFNSKKTKFIIAISLFVQAITFIVLFFVLLAKKKSIASIFGILGAAGAAAGSVLLISSLDEDSNGKKKLLHFDSCYDDQDDDGEIQVEILEEDDSEELSFGEEDI